MVKRLIGLVLALVFVMAGTVMAQGPGIHEAPFEYDHVGKKLTSGTAADNIMTTEVPDTFWTCKTFPTFVPAITAHASAVAWPTLYWPDFNKDDGSLESAVVPPVGLYVESAAEFQWRAVFRGVNINGAAGEMTAIDTVSGPAQWQDGVGAPHVNDKACYTFISGMVDTLYVTATATDSIYVYPLYNTKPFQNRR